METSNNSNKEEGFSLLELLIVIVILGILSATVYQYYSKNVEDTKMVRVRMDMEEIKKQIKRYMIKTQGIYPTSLEQLKGSYKIPNSPWGNYYKMDPDKHIIYLDYSKNNVIKRISLKYRPD